MVDECYLYIIRHRVKPIVYIGLTKDTKVRFREHKNNSSNSILKSYISEYGADAFTYDVLNGTSYPNLKGPIKGRDYL